MFVLCSSVFLEYLNVVHSVLHVTHFVRVLFRMYFQHLKFILSPMLKRRLMDTFGCYDHSMVTVQWWIQDFP